MMIRKIVAYKNYFIDFYKNQDLRVQERTEYILDLVRFERQLPEKFYNYLENTDGIYEIRVRTISKSIRILCFQDKGNLVILINCSVKKTQKTPENETKLAEKFKLKSKSISIK